MAGIGRYNGRRESRQVVSAYEAITPSVVVVPMNEMMDGSTCVSMQPPPLMIELEYLIITASSDSS